MSRENVLAVAEKYGLDMDGVRFSLDKNRRGSGPGREFYEARWWQTHKHLLEAE
ncbi:hypothetical protein KOI35_40710 [Actinoplanes bogorensis]|uniref:Uncharacterized protein n=1 Tax=Paractinoplanes bogorensis TaxID=1610840 RepID=A0ABS5Z2C9_9ACTN|nr:hypothetical protein [Actinoplanes bogorensis]MBU2669851.1 hypothetical protein [Actinoplanes bogorensis]